MRASLVLHAMLVAACFACAETPQPAAPSAAASASTSSPPREERPPVPTRPPCIAAGASPPAASHHAGENCITSGCHDGSEPKAPRWTVAGTVYVDRSGSTPASGATIEVVDASGHTVTIPTASDGNFHTTEAVTQPLEVRASRCPSDEPMIGKVYRAEGGCNQSNCHTPSLRMHL